MARGTATNGRSPTDGQARRPPPTLRPRRTRARRTHRDRTATPRRGDVPDRFFRDMVSSMRNGVIAITRDGHVAVMNEVACQALDIHVAAVAHRRALRRRAEGRAGDRPHPRHGVRDGASAEPRGAAAEVVGPGDRLHAVADSRRSGRNDRRDAVLQGSDARRTARRARAASRPAGRARRDGRRDRPRSEEPARGHRGDGGTAQAAAGRIRPTRSRC